MDVVQDALRLIETVVITVGIPWAGSYILKGYHTLRAGWDVQRAAMLDRLAAGLLEELLAGLRPDVAEQLKDPAPTKAAPGLQKLHRDLASKLHSHPNVPTKNPSVIRRVAAVAIRKTFRVAGGALLKKLP